MLLLDVFMIFIRKSRSAVINVLEFLRCLGFYVAAAWNPAIRIGSRCTFAKGVTLRAFDGGSIELGARVSLASNARIISQNGKVVIGNDVHIGVGSIIVCREGITIGSDTLIAEYVVIRDQDHDTSIRPVKHGGFLTAPVRIGCDVWIGAKATILRGTSIGDMAVIGAHALVRTDVPSGRLAVGVPARLADDQEGAM